MSRLEQMSLHGLVPAHTTLYLGRHADQLTSTIQRVIENTNAIVIRFSIAELLLRADSGQKLATTSLFDEYHPEEDNKYTREIEVPDGRQVREPKLIVVQGCEYVLVGFVSPTAAKAVELWMTEILDLCCEESALLVASLNLASLSEGPKTQTKLRQLKSLFQRIVTLEPEFSLTSTLASMPKIPFDEFWQNVLGYDNVKHELERLVRWRWHRPSDLKDMGISPSPGIILVGPSGCGKTFLAQQLGREPGLNFIEVKASNVFSKWYGDSEKAIRDIFAQARSNRPCILLMDEIESIAPERTMGTSDVHTNGVGLRVLSTLLNELDGVDSNNEGLVVIGATCNINQVDKALIRPGRLGSIVEVGLPNSQDRLLLLRHFWKTARLATDVDFSRIVNFTAGYTVAKLQGLCVAASYQALWENQSEIGMKHIQAGLGPFSDLI